MECQSATTDCNRSCVISGLTIVCVTPTSPVIRVRQNAAIPTIANHRGNLQPFCVEFQVLGHSCRSIPSPHPGNLPPRSACAAHSMGARFPNYVQASLAPAYTVPCGMQTRSGRQGHVPMQPDLFYQAVIARLLFPGVDDTLPRVSRPSCNQPRIS